MKIFLAILLLIPSLSWGEVINLYCEMYSKEEYIGMDVMLMGENIFLFDELDGFIRNTSGKKLNSGNTPLQELFHAHFNIDEELLKKLTRKTKSQKDKIGRQKKGRVDREQWKVGRKKKIIVSKVIPIRD